jgi:plasmid stabilization system protein ParE
MMHYSVYVTETTYAQISSYARYIAEEKRAPENARNWVDRVYTAIESLSYHPYRCELAVENDYRDYEIRRLRIGRYLVLYTIDETQQRVYAIGFRHGARLPRPNELPQSRDDF